METFLMPYLLSLVLLFLLPLSLYLIFFIGKKGSGDLKSLPPGSYGWPILGENVELSLFGFQQLVRERMQKYSPDIFKTSLLGTKMAVLCGAAGNKFVFTNENKHLFSQSPPTSLMNVLFPDLDRAMQHEPAVSFHNFQYDILKPEALKQHVPVMDGLAREHLRHSWRPNAEVAKALPLTKKYTLELACRLFMDVVDPERLGKLLEPFARMTDGLISLPVNFPGTAFNRAIRGARVVRGELMEMIRERRKEMMMTGSDQGREDLLSKMVVATNDDGVHMSDRKVLDVIVGLLVAGQYEVSSALTLVIHFLAQLPHIYDEVLREQMGIAKMKGPGEVLTWEDVEKMKYTWNVVRECFRLIPPGLGGFRETKTEITYAGFTIPKGWKIYWTGHSSHMNPNYFPEPEKVRSIAI